jgi:WD40 repeat protein
MHKQHTQSVLCLQFDRNYLVTGSSDSRVIIWSVADLTVKPIHILTDHQDSVLGVLFDRIPVDTSLWMQQSPSRQTRSGNAILLKDIAQRKIDVPLFTGSKDNSIRVWDLEKGVCLAVLVGHKSAVNSLSRQGDYLLSASGDRSIRVWNLKQGKCVRELLGHTRGIACIHSRGNILVSGSSDLSVKVWDFLTGQLLHEIPKAHPQLVRTIQFDGMRVLD